MRTLEEYMRLPYRMEIIPDTIEGGFAVRFPELPGCLTCADTMEEAVRNAEDCKREWLAAAIEDGTPIPEPMTDEEHSKAEGISMNQYCLYLLTKNDAVFHQTNA